MSTSLHAFKSGLSQAWWTLAVAVLFGRQGARPQRRYAVWSGVGTAIAAAIGIWYFKEPATALKMVSFGLLVIGVTGVPASLRA